jgi:hypothetical protein
MRLNTRLLILAAIFLAAAGLPAQPGPQRAPRAPFVPDGAADVLYYNGKIITMWEEMPVAESVAIGGGRILAVGDTQVVGRRVGPRTRQIDLEGKTMLPGLIDSHVHPIGAALAERDGEVPVMRDFAELRTYVEKAVQSTPASQLVFVPKVYSTRLQERRYPTRWELDKFSGSHKVMLDNGYASALNSAALAAAGITRETPQPEDGKIITDPKTGEPTGLILGARRLVSGLLDQRSFTHEDRVWALQEMHKAYNRVGLTSVIDRSQRSEGIRAYQELWEKGALTLRTNITLTLDGEAPLEDLTRDIRALTPSTGFGDDFLRIGSLKIFLDGGILIGTAYLRTPYGKHTEVYGFHDPDYRGVLRVPPEKITAMAKLANRLGWQMTAHTTGGASTDALLDAYEAADRERPIRDRRFTLTHANFPDDRAIARAKKLGVLMDLQPAWYHLDGPALATVLGPDRMKFFHPYKSIFDAGVIVAGGSDHMIKFDDKLAINPYNPFFGMWMVVTRKTADGTVYNPEQKITREQALKMWTWNAAYVSFDEEVKGSIEPGKLADFAIIDRDYLTCPEDEIQDIAVVQTIVGGEVVYDSAAPK